jgi:hypothetical protein
MSAVVSVDFDFLVYLPQDDRRVTLTGDEGQKTSGPARPVFDFAGGDGSLHTQTLWHLRRHQFAERCIDLEQVITARHDQGIPAIPRFCAALAGAFAERGQRELPTAAHQHHGEALRFLQERLGQVEQAVSFDAHHDLGYGAHDLVRARAGAYTVGSWLCGALNEGLADRVTVVYPDWRGLGEWRETSEDLVRCERLAALAGTERHWLAEHRERITVMTWS